MNLAFTITIGWIVVPIVLTLVMLWLMLAPDFRAGNNRSGWAPVVDMIDGFLRLLWLIPILLVWVVYLALR